MPSILADAAAQFNKTGNSDLAATNFDDIPVNVQSSYSLYDKKDEHETEIMTDSVFLPEKYVKTVVSSNNCGVKKRGIDLSLKLRNVLDDPEIFSPSAAREQNIAKLRQAELLRASILSNDTSLFGIQDTDDDTIVMSGKVQAIKKKCAKSKREKMNYKDDLSDPVNAEVSQIMMERSSYSSRDSSTVRRPASNSRSCSRDTSRASDTEERSLQEDGSRSEDISIKSGNKFSRSGRESKKSVTGSGRSKKEPVGSRRSRHGSSTSRISHRTDSASSVATPSETIKILPLDDVVMTSPVVLNEEKSCRAQTSADVSASISSTKLNEDVGRCYDISSIMAGRGVFRVGGGGSFKGEITKTKEEDSYIGTDDDNDEANIYSANNNSETNTLVSRQPGASRDRLSSHPADMRETRISSFDSLMHEQATGRGRSIDPDTWCQFMSSDWFSDVVEAGAVQRIREGEFDDDSSVITDTGEDGSAGSIFKSAVKNCFCTPFRVPAAHI